MHKTVEVIRERELYSKEISFIYNAENKINEMIKRIGYPAKVMKLLNLLLDSLSFL